MPKIEILAPVGSEEMLRAAVFSGADAVYLGFAGFNARTGAGNFTADSLKEAVRFCHVRGVKVHVALNTTVYGGELAQLADAVRAVAESGADAVICQDLAVAQLIGQIAPRLPRHGSTQTAAKGHGGKGKGAPDMKMWGITNTGLVRSENQDAYAAFTVGGYSAAVVCDGMGGTNGGRVASGIAVEQFEKELRAVLQENAGEEQLRQATLYAISLANDAIRRAAAQNADYQHMGTTLVCALAKEDLVMVGNIGDSRAYHINGEGIRQISRDHSVVESMVEKGNITPQEARRHPNRNLITRALGPDIQAQADTFAVAWHPGDFILLCTDGLVNTVSDQEMLFEVLHDGDIESCLDHLMQISLRRGAPDNVTVVLLMNT